MNSPSSLLMDYNETFMLNDVEATWTVQMDNDPIGIDEDESAFETSEGSLVQLSKFSIAVTMIVCCLVGFFGNIMSTIIFLHNDMRSPINHLLAAVSIIDLSLLLLVIPVLILPGLNMVLKCQFLETLYTGSILYVYPLGVMSRTASMWTYVLVGIERYVAVCQPLKSYKLLTNRQAKCAQLVIVVISILYNICRFFEYRWNSETGQLEPFLHGDPFYFLFFYTTLHLVTHYLLPISVILILHACIVLNLKHAHDGRLSLTNGSTVINGERRQKSTTLMIVVATGVFVACNSLSFLVNLWETIDPRGLEDERWSTFVHVMTDLANLLLALHSACSFLIYMKFCRQYRQLFCRLIGCGGGDRSASGSGCDGSAAAALRRGSDAATSASGPDSTALLSKRRKAWRTSRTMTLVEDSFKLSQLNEQSSTESFRPRLHSDLLCLRQSSSSFKKTDV